jgi:hypothetical protein
MGLGIIGYLMRYDFWDISNNATLPPSPKCDWLIRAILQIYQFCRRRGTKDETITSLVLTGGKI